MFQAFNGELTSSRQNLESTEQALQEITEHVAKDNAQKETLSASYQQALKRSEKLSQDLKSVEAALSDLEESNSFDTSLQSERQKLENLESDLAQSEKNALEAEDALKIARRIESDASEPAIEAKQNLSILKTELKTLISLIQGNDNAWDKVIDSIQINSGYETALSVALGDSLDASDDENAPSFWRSPFSDAMVMPLPSDATSLLRYCCAPESLHLALSQIGLVDADKGLKLQKELSPGQCLVSREGHLWRWDGYTLRETAQTANARRLQQKNRVAVLQSTIEKTEEHSTQFEHKLSLAQKASEEAARADQAARQAIRRLREDVDFTRKNLDHLERKASDFATKQRHIKERFLALQETYEQSLQDVEFYKKSLDELSDSADLMQQHFEAKQNATVARARVTQVESRIGALQREEKDRLNKLQAIELNKKKWSSRLEEANQHIETLHMRHVALASEEKDISDAPEQLKASRLRIVKDLQASDINRKSCSDNLAQAEKSQHEADSVAQAALVTLSQCRETRVRIEERIDSIEEKIDSLTNQVADIFDTTPLGLLHLADLKNYENLPDINQIEGGVDRLKAERERFGGVNLSAEREVEDLSERYGILIKERDDLIEAITRLRQAIANLNKEGRERLLQAFQDVNSRFGTLFERLFNGGAAELKLVDSDDPLDAGLEILANPPGKKPQTITLLSGGEQTLTAIALIFAVFLTNPAPICVLDEVDAPLDDANVERFCNLLADMSERTQTRFLVITHNPITMARMNRLFGITMAEKGVSQVVSVDLQTGLQFRETA
jgi:chromosome segregation protein